MDYANLQSTIVSALGKDDLGALIINAIGLVESELSLTLRTSELQVYGNISANLISDGAYTLPDDLVELKRVQNNGMDIEQMNPEVADTATCTPVGYYIIDDQVIIRAAPDPENDIFITYYKRVPVLSNANTTNDILEKYTGLYVNGALKYVSMWTLDLESASAYGELYNSLLTGVNKLHARRRGKPRLSVAYDIGQNYRSTL